MSTTLFKRSPKWHREDAREGGYQHALSWLTWWAAFAFATLLAFSRLSYGLLLPDLHADLHASYGILGTVATVNFVGYLLGMLLMPGLLAHVRNRGGFNLVALLATNLLLIVSAFSPTVEWLAILRLLSGIPAAFATVLTLSLTLECMYPQERGQASGIVWMGGALGLVISGVIAPPIIGMGTHGGWRLVWIFDRWPTGFTVAVALALGVCGSLAVLTNVAAMEYVGAAIVGLSALIAPPIMISVLLKRAVPDAGYAVSLSTLTAIFALGQIVGPFLGGIVIEQLGLEAGIATSAILFTLATMCACGYGWVQRKN